MSGAAGPLSHGGALPLTAGDIAVLVGGALHGDASQQVTGVAALDRAGAGQLSFLADKRYSPHLLDTGASVVLLAPEFANEASRAKARIVVAKPYDALVALLPKFHAAVSMPVGIHPTAVVSPTASLGAGVAVEAHAVIGDGAMLGDRAWVGPHCVVAEGVTIGADSRLVGNVSCYPGTAIGERVVVHAGVRIGSDGFGYAFADGAHQKIPHVGRCVIGDDVEIGANTCIDRGSVDDTVIGAGTKIDNLVHIAHNVRIGRLCLLMAQSGLAGSARIEDGVIIAGQAGIGGHVTIGQGARIGAQSGIICDVPAGETWSGYPGRPHKESMRASAALLRLSALLKRIEQLLDNE